MERNKEGLKFNPEEIKVSGDGVFYTLQGEGVTMGEPAVFLRMHVCNLQCSWCDTPYTWNKDLDEFWTGYENWSIPETANNIREVWGVSNPDVQKRVVLTGGEPLLQQEQIVKLIDILGDDWEIEIETNGTIMPKDELLARCQFNCSPKLDNSGGGFKARVKPDTLNRLSKGNTTFKFVVRNVEDVLEIESDFINGVGLPRNQIILMPEGTSSEELKKHATAVAEYAKERGFRLLGRLQTELWGKTRGV